MKLKTFIKFLKDETYIKFVSDTDLVACHCKEFEGLLKDHKILDRDVIGIDTTSYVNIFTEKRYPCLFIAVAERKTK